MPTSPWGHSKDCPDGGAGIRPECLRITSEGLRAVVMDSVFLGSVVHILAKLDSLFSDDPGDGRKNSAVTEVELSLIEQSFLLRDLGHG